MSEINLQKRLAAVENQRTREHVKLIELLHKHGTGETDEQDGEKIDEMVERLVYQRDTLRTALEQYADPGNWHVGSKYDGESRSFTGPEEARKALDETEQRP